MEHRDGVPARHEIAAIKPVKEHAEDELLGRPGVVGVDLGEKVRGGRGTGEPSILIFVTRKKPEAELASDELIPAEIEGVPTDVQEMVIELQSARQRVEEGRQVDGSRYPVLAGGISMGPSRAVSLAPPDVAEEGEYTFVGTLGALVRDRGSGAVMAMTNFHVACVDDQWSAGDRMVQPGRPDGGDPAADEFGTLTRAQLTENTDGAVVTLDEGRQWSAEVTGVGSVTGIAEAAPGLEVQKRGRTTEHTAGTVASTEASLSLDYGDGLGSRTFRRQVRITTDAERSERFSDGGDSGSVVLDADRRVVGLLFAGSTDGSTTFANPIAAVLEELDVEVQVGQPAEEPEVPPAAGTGGCTVAVTIGTVNITVNH
ncbi:hypothetical protein [Citricoccus nitrophenolicus]|uniref:hypothetical protein n=1 Tax=Citricoccus nitrophenolicus TaxID=863575 RepID=UPI0039B53F37